MQFNQADTQGFVYEVNTICNSDDNSFPLASKAQRANFARSRFLTIAFQADGRWSYDLLSQTTAPLRSVDLVAGTENYALDTFTDEILKVERVEILDQNGKGWKLEKLDEDMDVLEFEALTQFNAVAGLPVWYRLFGKYIYIYPKPSYNSTEGLTLYVSRNDSDFAESDTTKDFGVPSLFNQYICNLASLPYLIELQKPQKNDIAAQIAKDEQAIKEYFAHRDEGERQIMTTKRVRSFR